MEAVKIIIPKRHYWSPFMRNSWITCRLVVYLSMISLVAVGCSTMKPAIPPTVKAEMISGPFQIGQIINMATGKTVSFDELIDQLETKDLVFIGETHDNAEHHLIQVQILQALIYRHDCPLTIGMEFFQPSQQQVLDQYMEGALTEEMFLKNVGWREGWGFDYHFYRPLIVMAKERGSKILAINAPRDITRKVARSGLSSLEPKERNELARDIDLKNESHRAYLWEVYKKHPHLNLKSFDLFYQAQCVWEDTMAENIGKFLTKDKRKMVVFTGNGHIIKKFGIPDRTLKHAQVDLATVVLLPLTGQMKIEKETADFIWITGSCSRQKLLEKI
jgi:uncharacterized iron-regulated protein